jgi:hypothetical protein
MPIYKKNTLVKTGHTPLLIFLFVSGGCLHEITPLPAFVFAVGLCQSLNNDSKYRPSSQSRQFSHTGIP